MTGKKDAPIREDATVQHIDLKGGNAFPEELNSARILLITEYDSKDMEEPVLSVWYVKDGHIGRVK